MANSQAATKPPTRSGFAKQVYFSVKLWIKQTTLCMWSSSWCALCKSEIMKGWNTKSFNFSGYFSKGEVKHICRLNGRYFYIARGLRYWGNGRHEKKQDTNQTILIHVGQLKSTVVPPKWRGAGIHKAPSFHHIQTGVSHNEIFCRDLQWTSSHPRIRNFVCFKLTCSFPALINEWEMEVKGNK